MTKVTLGWSTGHQITSKCLRHRSCNTSFSLCFTQSPPWYNPNWLTGSEIPTNKFKKFLAVGELCKAVLRSTPDFKKGTKKKCVSASRRSLFYFILFICFILFSSTPTDCTYILHSSYEVYKSSNIFSERIWILTSCPRGPVVALLLFF